MAERLLVIGGDAAGMSTAAHVKRMRGDDLEVVVLERGSWTSYSACGIPYWVAGDVDDQARLVARSPEEHRRRGVDVRMHTEAVAVDLDRREVEARDLDAGTSTRMGFDHLMIATGARPVRPPLPGVDADGIYGVQSLDDGARLLEGLQENPRRAVVVGAGYIGVEMAEAMLRHGLEVTVVDMAPEPMTTLDPDMGALVREAMEKMGIEVRTGTPVEAFEVKDGRVTGVVTPQETIPADVVVLGIGVRPASELARDAGLPLGPSGGIRTDLQMRVPGHDGVWAAGDCVEVIDRVTGRWAYVPLGTHANKQGRVVATNIGGGYATFPGVVRTAVSKVCNVEIGRTGLLEHEARTAGYAFVTATIRSTTRAGYFPGAAPVTVKVIAERRSGRLLGAQIVGREHAGKRIDAAAVALWNGMTVEEVTGLDLAYAPPFSPVWDPVLIAARKAAEMVQRRG